MDIGSTLEKMPRRTGNKVKEMVEKYLRTGDRCYAEIAIGILEGLGGENTKELILALKKR